MAEPGLASMRGAAQASGPAMTEKEFTLLQKWIHRRTGIWMGSQKRNLLVSRLARRLRELGLESFESYYHRLEREDDGGKETRLAINRITTNKTEFFREPAHFDFLRDQVARRGVRIWCVACSTGEEPYSLAMTLCDCLGTRANWNVLASDLDTDVLATAAAGIYDEMRIAQLPAGYKKQFFLKGKGSFEGVAKIRPEVRSHLEFRQINLIGRDWPDEASFDAVFCRNVLIYFDNPTRTRVVDRLAARLVPGGHLFLGSSESLQGPRPRLKNVAHTVYRLEPAGV